MYGSSSELSPQLFSLSQVHCFGIHRSELAHLNWSFVQPHSFSSSPRKHSLVPLHLYTISNVLLHLFYAQQIFQCPTSHNLKDCHNVGRKQVFYFITYMIYVCNQKSLLKISINFFFFLITRSIRHTSQSKLQIHSLTCDYICCFHFFCFYHAGTK